MAMIIDGNSNSVDKRSKFRNLGAIPRILIASFLTFIAIFILVSYMVKVDRLYDSTKKEPSVAFVEDFFLAGYENGSDACRSLNLTSSYNSCVVYYDNEFHPTYNNVDFDYSIEILYGMWQRRASVTLKNTTSTNNNFNYTEIQFQLVQVYNQDRYYEYDSSENQLIMKDNTSSFEVLFSTINLIS